MYAIMDGFDIGFAFRASLSKVLRGKVDLHVLTTSRSSCHIAFTLVATKERRLILDVHLLREAYERREITKNSWIAGKSSIPDCLTKRKHNGFLLKAMTTHKIEIQLEG